MLSCWFKENFTSWKRKWFTLSAQQCKCHTKQCMKQSSKQFAKANPLNTYWEGCKIPFTLGFQSVLPSTLKMVVFTVHRQHSYAEKHQWEDPCAKMTKLIGTYVPSFKNDTFIFILLCVWVVYLNLCAIPIEPRSKLTTELSLQRLHNLLKCFCQRYVWIQKCICY